MQNQDLMQVNDLREAAAAALAAASERVEAAEAEARHTKELYVRACVRAERLAEDNMKLAERLKLMVLAAAHYRSAYRLARHASTLWPVELPKELAVKARELVTLAGVELADDVPAAKRALAKRQAWLDGVQRGTIEPLAELFPNPATKAPRKRRGAYRKRGA